MRYLKNGVIAVLSVVFALVALVTVSMAAVGQTVTQVISSGGISRDFVYYEPAGATTGLPLVIALHGAGGDGATYMNDSTEGVWNSLADSRGFYVAYPNAEATSKVWNACEKATTTGDQNGDGDPDDGGYDPTTFNASNLDDVQFIDDVITWFAANKGVDTARVYVSGTSSGGFMTLRLARELTDRFKAFGPNIATQYIHNECAAPNLTTLNTDGRKMLFLYGDADQWILPNGGCASLPAHNDCRAGVTASASISINQWKSWFAINQTTVEVPMANPVFSDWTRQYWRDHKKDGELRLRVVRVGNGGHSVPGNTPIPPLVRILFQLGWRNLDINHIETTADFFGL